MDELGRKDLSHRWHPYSSAEDLAKNGPVVIRSGQGVRVTDVEGKTYIDGHAALWLMNVGWGRESLVEAAAQQMRQLAWFSSFERFSNEPAIRLSEHLAEMLAPEGMTRFFFSGSGSEAVETALKIARQYWLSRGKPRKVKLIGRTHAYHGVTFGAMSVGGITANRQPFEPLLPGVRHSASPFCYRCELGRTYPECGLACANDLERVIRFEGPDTVAAFIAEPVQGAGGVIIPPEDYLQRVAAICKAYDVLFIADEVITGFGRTGRMFGARRYGVKPDIMTFAKGITSGYVPLGCTAVREEVYQAYAAPGITFRHGNTYSGHPVACAVALANLKIIEEEDLPARADAAGAHLRQILAPLTRHPSVGDVGAVGLLGRVELVRDKAARQPMEPAVVRRVVDRILELGVILRAVGSVITLSPPLIIETGDLDRIVEAIDRAVGEVADPEAAAA